MATITKTRPTRLKKSAVAVSAVVIAALWVLMAVFLPQTMLHSSEEITANISTDITADFEYKLTKTMPDIVEIAYGDKLFESTQKVYTLSDRNLVAPTPNHELYGEASSPAEMAGIMEEAAFLLEDQEMLFTTETEILEGSKIQYYLDDTIFAITWKQVVDGGVYTFSEVKIAHASQFRRFLSDGKFGSFAAYTTQEMAISVNAVVASSGDYYIYRGTGVCVNDGIVYRADPSLLDTCFIDENGDLLFSYRGELEDEEAIKKYVDEHDVRFSISFGPVIIVDGESVVPSYYNVGEIYDNYARAALCQMGNLHYVVVASNYEHPHNAVHSMFRFTENLINLGITKAYALDGGQTTTIVMDNEVINSVSYGAQRRISDIIYFATAIPEEEWR